MQQADVRIHTLYDLAIEFQHHSQDTVGGWVLRAEIDCEIA